MKRKAKFKGGETVKMPQLYGIFSHYSPNRKGWAYVSVGCLGGWATMTFKAKDLRHEKEGKRG